MKRLGCSRRLELESKRGVVIERLQSARIVRIERSYDAGKETLERAAEDKAEGKSPSTGEFVREEIEHVREGKHSARSTKQAIAIGLSKARRAGVKLQSSCFLH